MDVEITSFSLRLCRAVLTMPEFQLFDNALGQLDFNLTTGAIKAVPQHQCTLMGLYNLATEQKTDA